MTHLWFFIANGFVSFLASLAAFIVWHHWDVAERWDARGVRKARERDGDDLLDAPDDRFPGRVRW